MSWLREREREREVCRLVPTNPNILAPCNGVGLGDQGRGPSNVFFYPTASREQPYIKLDNLHSPVSHFTICCRIHWHRRSLTWKKVVIYYKTKELWHQKEAKNRLLWPTAVLAVTAITLSRWWNIHFPISTDRNFPLFVFIYLLYSGCYPPFTRVTNKQQLQGRFTFSNGTNSELFPVFLKNSAC